MLMANWSYVLCCGIVVIDAGEGECDRLPLEHLALAK